MTTHVSYWIIDLDKPKNYLSPNIINTQQCYREWQKPEIRKFFDSRGVIVSPKYIDYKAEPLMYRVVVDGVVIKEFQESVMIPDGKLEEYKLSRNFLRRYLSLFNNSEGDVEMYLSLNKELH